MSHQLYDLVDEIELARREHRPAAIQFYRGGKPAETWQVDAVAAAHVMQAVLARLALPVEPVENEPVEACLLPGEKLRWLANSANEGRDGIARYGPETIRELLGHIAALEEAAR